MTTSLKRFICAVVALVTMTLAISAFAALSPTEIDSETGVWLVEFDRPGLIRNRGQVAGLQPTAPSRSGQGIDRDAPAVSAFLGWADSELDREIAAVAAAIGRVPEVTHKYRVTQLGMAVRLSRDEALVVEQLPGVASVEAEQVWQLATDVGPWFIGADQIWDGSATPTGAAGATRGQGVIVGIADAGLNNPNHPSFTPMGSECGYSDASPQPKLLATLDCINSNDCSGAVPGDGGSTHGVHVAGTAVGNHISQGQGTPPAPEEMSGVAPCARAITYRVCGDTGCPGAAILAAINRMPLDGVQVANFSLGPVGPAQFSPWNPSEGSLRYLALVEAGIFTAVAAGNTRPANQGGPENPTGNVKSTGPWVTTVANSTHSGTESIMWPLVEMTGPAPVPVQLAEFTVATSNNSQLFTATLTDVPFRHYPQNLLGCDDGGGFPAGYFADGVALIQRGVCNFAEKADNAGAAGAEAVIIYNNVEAPISLDLSGSQVPAFSLKLSEGQALVDFIESTPGNEAQVTFNVPAGSVFGDVLSGGSLTGPAQFTNGITKPDIGAPGSNILAASAGGYSLLSGTSMASPHVAGAAALVRAVHPDWTVAEVKSALMLTAHTNGFKPDATFAWDADDVGSGRVDLGKAALSGLVMDIPVSEYLAVDPFQGGDPRTLNLPTMRDTDCSPDCGWSRRVRNTLDGSASWSATAVPGNDFALAVSPTQFELLEEGILFRDDLDGTGAPVSSVQDLEVTVTGADVPGRFDFGHILLSEDTDQAPDARLSVAVGQPPLAR